MSGYPGNRANQQPSAGYPGSERAPPAVTQQSDPHSLSPQQVAMSTCHLCCSCLLIVSLIATIPIGFLVWQGTRDVLDDEEFQLKCIDQYDDDIAMSPPNDLELDVLMACTYIMILALMGFCYLAKKKKDSLLRMCAPCLLGTSGGVLIITAFALSALFIHVFWYVNELNSALYESSPSDCYIDDQWQEAYDDASAGVWVGLCVFLLFCCVVYVAFQLKKSLSDIDIPPALTLEQGLDQLGFSIATVANRKMLLDVLKSEQPKGQRALRDAIAFSILKMVSFIGLTSKGRLSVLGHKIIHIVLTDGVDNNSQRPLDDIKDFYHRLGSYIGDRFLKSYFIGIDLGSQERRELQSIADLAGELGDAAELLNCDDAKKLSDIFSHITLSLGIEKRVALNTDGTDAEETFYLKEERQRFFVLFNLDMGSSMRGTRWNSLLSALNLFFAKLDESDVIGCVLFNHEALCITGERLTIQKRILSAMTDPDVIRSVLFKK
eukprot:1150968_1